MKATLLSVPALLAAEAAAAGCNADNCIRALRATQTPGRLETARAFCSAFTTTAVAATAVPSFAVDACKDNQDGPLSARLSSACSCIATTTAAPTPTPTEACAAVSKSWAAQSSAGVGKAAAGYE